MAKHGDNSLAQRGWYFYGQQGREALWTETYWSGQVRENPAITSSQWKRRPWGFLTHAWFWWLVAGTVLSTISGVGIWHAKTAKELEAEGREAVFGFIFGWYSWALLCGMLATMVGLYLLLGRHWNIGKVQHWRGTLLWGVVAGAFASAAALALEGYAEPVWHIPYWIDLAFAGPVEETLKLVIPLLLWLVGPRYLREPLNGVLLVFTSAAVFGIQEGVTYVWDAAGSELAVVMGAARPVSELLHPSLTLIAASLIWLVAVRTGRLFSWLGVLGWVIAMALHSLHDTIGANVHSSATNAGDSAANIGVSDPAVFWGTMIVLPLYALLWFFIAFQVMRVFGRELTPPDAIAHNPPRWRPLLRPWGVK